MSGRPAKQCASPDVDIEKRRCQRRRRGAAGELDARQAVSEQCPKSKVGAMQAPHSMEEWANQTPLLILRLDYLNIASRRKFHLAFLPFFFRSKSIHEDATTVASLPTAACCLFSLRRILRRLTLLD